MTVARWWRSHNVRVRLTLWYVTAMVIVLAVYAAAVFAFVSQNASETLNRRLRGDFQWASAMVDQTPDGSISWYEDITEEESFWLQVWGEDGRILYQNIGARRSPITDSRELALQADNNIVSIDHPVAPVRVLTRHGRIGSMPVIIQVGRSELTMREELQQLALILALGLPLAVVVAGLGGYTLARRALLPVERMTERARLITAERLHDRLPVANPDDEMGRLARVFNQTLARLEGSFEQMRRFTADVSHQLRTPLTAIRSVGEVGLREPRDSAAYRGIIGSMLEEADRLATLVDRLLTLSRAETGQARLSIAAFDVHELAREVGGHLEVLAEEKGQSIVVEGAGAPHAHADRLVVRQAVINLVDNAIKFTPEGGRILIRTVETPTEAIVDVVDSGSGVPASMREHIFDRFYTTTDVNTPGAGLGLSIAKGAIEANNGRLLLVASDSSGSTFRISLPRAAAGAREARPARADGHQDSLRRAAG